MIPQISFGMQFFISILAVWRLTHLFVSEDGPWDFVFRIRKKLGNSMVGKAMDCFYCLSLWMSVPFALLINEYWPIRLICWISISGGACLLEQFTASPNNKDQN
jgi:hypothetical protein